MGVSRQERQELQVLLHRVDRNEELLARAEQNLRDAEETIQTARKSIRADTNKINKLKVSKS